MKILTVYYAIAIAILLTGYLFPSTTDYATDVPIALSLVLLIPIYLLQRNIRKKKQLNAETKQRDTGTTVLWALALFALAMSVRIPSVLLLRNPYEKTPLIFLLFIVIIVIERKDPTAFGFKTKRLPKALLYGLVFFLILAGVSVALTHALIYYFTGLPPTFSFDVVTSILTFPFMTFCVGVSEEGLFRGYMLTHFEKKWPPYLAILLQAALFGLWHFVWDLSPFNPAAMIVYIGDTFFFGLLFGYLYFKTRNLVPVILAHGLWNSVAAIVSENPQISGNPVDYFGLGVALSVIPFAVSYVLTFLFAKYSAKEI